MSLVSNFVMAIFFFLLASINLSFLLRDWNELTILNFLAGVLCTITGLYNIDVVYTSMKRAKERW